MSDWSSTDDPEDAPEDPDSDHGPQDPADIAGFKWLGSNYREGMWTVSAPKHQDHDEQERRSRKKQRRSWLSR
jgi:hypothetical protein